MSKRIPYLIYCFILAIGTTACHQVSETTESQTAVKTPVKITHLSQGPLVETIELNATSAYLKKNTVRSTATGYIEKCYVEPGASVKAGELLYTLTTKEAKALENHRSDSAMSFSGLLRIKAPKSGIVCEITQQTGDYIQDGDALCSIADENSFAFLLEVPAEMLSSIHLNNHCDIKLPDGGTIPGNIISKLPVMDQNSQTQTFIVKPISARQFPVNLLATVSIAKKVIKDAWTLPKTAVLTNETMTEFWVMKLTNDSIAVKTPITKGIETTDKVEIFHPAFSASDRIIFWGNYGLPDTTKVTIVNQ